MQHHPQSLIIALTGHPNVGKDTVAGVLAPKHGFRSIAFADALRLEVSEAWRIDMRMLTCRETKELPIPALAAGMCNAPGFLRWCVDSGESLTEPRSPRWVMQRWGSYQRRFTPDHYVQVVERWIKHRIGVGWHRLVVSDLRFVEEARMLRRYGTQVVRVHRPEIAPLAADTASHISERHACIEVDADIVNDGSLQALAEATLRCVTDLGASHGND